MKKCIAALGFVMLVMSCQKELSESTSIESQNFSSQPAHRCQSDLHMSQYYHNHPHHRDAILAFRSEIANEKASIHLRSEEVLTVPVHIIIVHPPGQSVGSGVNFSVPRIESQMDRINADFRMRNTDASKTPSVFPRADSKIQFCLAKTDPNGRSHSGITRYATRSNFERNEIAIKSATGWDPNRYLNIWVAPTIDGLGFAYLPSNQELPDPDVDGAAILSESFGNGQGEYPYHLGRTLTHEIGHYLGLDHIWGDGCGIDDGIRDTPPQRDANEGCPRHPSPSCGNQGDMFMNYMDYSDDECLFAFTPGQAQYMRSILLTSRRALINHGAKYVGQSLAETLAATVFKTAMKQV